MKVSKNKIATKEVLNFKYCECGCHGHECSVMGNHYWLYNDLNGNFTLKSGHGIMGFTIGRYKSFEEAVDVATAQVKLELKKVKNIFIKVPV